MITDGARIIEDNQAVWKEFKELDYEDEDFNRMGELLEKEYAVKTGCIGNASAKLFSLRESVDFAQTYFEKNNHKNM